MYYYSIGEKVGLEISKTSKYTTPDEINALFNTKTATVVGFSGELRNIKTDIVEPHYILDIAPECNIAQSSLRKLHRGCGNFSKMITKIKQSKHLQKH